jgi:hypothetical protein
VVVVRGRVSPTRSAGVGILEGGATTAPRPRERNIERNREECDRHVSGEQDWRNEISTIHRS